MGYEVECIRAQSYVETRKSFKKLLISIVMSGELGSATKWLANLNLSEATTLSSQQQEAFAKALQYEQDQRDLAEVFSLPEAGILATVVALFSIFGIVANTITFLVILITPKLSGSVFNVFLMSLCVSDFLSALISPFVLYRQTWGFYEWSIPHIFCKLAPAVDFWTTCVTIQHILVFSILRFVSIKFPHRFRYLKTIHAKIIVTFIWIEAFGSSFVVYFLWPGVFPPGKRTPGGAISKACTAQPAWIGVLLQYVQFGFPTILYAPMAAVVVVTVALGLLILKRKREKNKVNQQGQKATRKENFALVQLALIIASFMLGYLPDLSYRMTAIIIRSYNQSLTARGEWVFTITAHCLLRLSECLNPIFYNLGSSNMRKATRQFLKRIWHHNSDDSFTDTTNRTPNDATRSSTKQRPL